MTDHGSNNDAAAFVSITRVFQFCAGHRVFQHESKCSNLHGHNYRAHVTITARDGKSLDHLGRVVDFSRVKAIIGEWIEAEWDHGFVFFVDDYDVKHIVQGGAFKGYAMAVNPTAENMARHLLQIGGELLALHGYPELCVSKVVLWETENCMAEVTL